MQHTQHDLPLPGASSQQCLSSYAMYQKLSQAVYPGLASSSVCFIMLVKLVDVHCNFFFIASLPLVAHLRCQCTVDFHRQKGWRRILQEGAEMMNPLQRLRNLNWYSGNFFTNHLPGCFLAMPFEVDFLLCLQFPVQYFAFV